MTPTLTRPRRERPEREYIIVRCRDNKRIGTMSGTSPRHACERYCQAAALQHLNPDDLHAVAATRA